MSPKVGDFNSPAKRGFRLFAVFGRCRALRNLNACQASLLYFIQDFTRRGSWIPIWFHPRSVESCRRRHGESRGRFSSVRRCKKACVRARSVESAVSRLEESVWNNPVRDREHSLIKVPDSSAACLLGTRPLETLDQNGNHGSELTHACWPICRVWEQVGVPVGAAVFGTAFTFLGVLAARRDERRFKEQAEVCVRCLQYILLCACVRAAQLATRRLSLGGLLRVNELVTCTS